MNTYDTPGAQTAKRANLGLGAARLVFVLVIGISAGGQSVGRSAEEAVAPRGTRSATPVAPARPRTGLERFAAYKLRRIAQQPESVPKTDVPVPSVTPMESLDLRVPDLSELSTAAETDRVEIPDYANAVFAESATITMTKGGERGWTASIFAWEASALGHAPLYFEDVNLERHGHSFGFAQPAVSAGLALGHLVALPYQMVAEPPYECIYTLGEERPGNCVPCQLRLPPFSLPAGVAEAAVVAGLILLIP